MAWPKDITGVDIAKPGSYRSLNGAADESIFQGRASKAGFYCFFKVWRDMPYDAVLDYEGILYRVEVKGSSGNSFDLTRGTRSGQQIQRGAGVSRTRHLDRSDCDFVVAIDSNNGDCYILPEDIVEIAGEAMERYQIAHGTATKSFKLSTNNISEYKEKWKLMMGGTNSLTKEQTRDGLRNLPSADIAALATSLGVVVPAGDLRIPNTRMVISDADDKAVFLIWKTIAQRL